MGAGAAKIPIIEFEREVANIADPIELDVTATIADSDGDSSSDTFGVDLLMDVDLLTGPDIEFLGTNESKAFNVDLSNAVDQWVVNNFGAGDSIALLNPGFDHTLVDNSDDAVIALNGTTITVVDGADGIGTDVTAADILVAYSDRIIDGDVVAWDDKLNSLIGSADADALIGKGDNDTLFGGDGADAFVFLDPSEGTDTISDFNASEGDFLVVSAARFDASLSEGPLGDSGVAVGDASEYIDYDSTTGLLSLDSDGSGLMLVQLWLSLIWTLELHSRPVTSSSLPKANT